MFVMFIWLGENRSWLFVEGMSLNQLLHDVNSLRMITTFRTMVGVFLNSGKKPECVIPCFQAECCQAFPLVSNRQYLSKRTQSKLYWAVSVVWKRRSNQRHLFIGVFTASSLEVISKKIVNNQEILYIGLFYEMDDGW